VTLTHEKCVSYINKFLKLKHQILTDCLSLTRAAETDNENATEATCGVNYCIALYNILIEFGIPRKLVGLIKMCLNETYSRVRIGKNLSLQVQH
jgi:hypothetical protein